MAISIKKYSSKRRTVVALLLLAAIVIAGGGYAWHRQRVDQSQAKTAAQHSVQPEGTVNYDAAPAADNDANDARKGSSSPSTTLNSGSSSKPTSFTVQIINARPGTTFHIGNLVNGITSGTCSLTASKAGQSTLQLATSSIVQDVNAYDCGTFSSVSSSQFPARGNWDLLLTVTSGSETASDSITVTI